MLTKKNAKVMTFSFLKFGVQAFLEDTLSLSLKTVWQSEQFGKESVFTCLHTGWLSIIPFYEHNDDKKLMIIIIIPVMKKSTFNFTL